MDFAGNEVQYGQGEGEPSVEIKQPGMEMPTPEASASPDAPEVDEDDDAPEAGE